MADVSVACDVYAWMSVVAKHINFEDCIAAAMEVLSRGLPLASFSYTKWFFSHIFEVICTEVAHAPRLYSVWS